MEQTLRPRQIEVIPVPGNGTLGLSLNLGRGVDELEEVMDWRSERAVASCADNEISKL
jgi:hypothetical protein